MLEELPVAQAKVSRLESILERLDPSNHTNAYNKLRKLIDDNQNIGGRQLNIDMDEILRNAGIKNAFKEGGSINKEKINKFLKYAKG